MDDDRIDIRKTLDVPQLPLPTHMVMPTVNEDYELCCGHCGKVLRFDMQDRYHHCDNCHVAYKIILNMKDRNTKVREYKIWKFRE